MDGTGNGEGMSPIDQSYEEQNSPQDQEEQAVSCEEGSCCVSESVTQEKPESAQTPNIAQALAATPVHTQSTSKPATVTRPINTYTDNTDKVDDGKQWQAHRPNLPLAIAGCLFCGVALELCWYCLKSLPIEDLNLPQVDGEDVTLTPSGERVHYQRDPRPHFGVAQSSRSVSFPLWDSDRPREVKRGEEEEEEEEAMDSVSCCPHCHLGLPRDTLRWHEAKCLLFDG